MIQKVSTQNKSAWIENDEPSFEREGMNKSAVNSFSNVVVVAAKSLIAKGEKLVDVAAKFKLDPKFLQQMIEGSGTTKVACACDQDEEKERWNRTHHERVAHQPEMKSDLRAKASASKAKDRELSDEELAAIEAYNSLHNIKSASTPSLPTNSSKRILTNKGNDVVDTGGARKQMGFERNNSIFDAEVIARQAKEQSNDEMLRANAADRSKQREEAKHASRYQTIDGVDIVEALKSVDQRKDAGVRSMGATEAHKYDKKLPMNGISIFDTKEFERVPEKTAGDKRRDEIKEAAAKPKDRSWVETGSKQVTSTDLVNNFINSMLKGSKKG